jgi:MoaA/NifB/PqqE/SkfB family radical SAM enzyme
VPETTRPLLPERLPEVIYIETSNSCNSLCAMCPLTFFGNGPSHNLTLDELDHIVGQLPDLRRVVLHGLGEPLLNRDLPEMIRRLKARGIYTLFNSNIIALTRQRQEQLVLAGLDELRVSLDAATPASYARIRGVPAHGRVVKHLGEMVETRARLGSRLPQVSVWFTALRENVTELAATARIAAGAGADEFYVQRLVFAEYGLARAEQSLYGRIDAVERSQLREAAEIARAAGMGFRASGDTVVFETLEGAGAFADEEARLAAARPWMACRRPWYLTYITAHGDVLPCCFIPFVNASSEPAYALGNVFQQSLAEIWSGAAYQEFRRRFLTAEPFDCCRGCGSKWSV